MFGPFGPIDQVQMRMEGGEHGYAFLQYQSADAAQMAISQMNGLEIAGRPIKVNHVTDPGSGAQQAAFGGGAAADLNENDGLNLSATSRAALMQKLSRGDGA
eukprot:SAG22_NODE_203_length_15320_cov_14.023516_4_plen_102_part_00